MRFAVVMLLLAMSDYGQVLRKHSPDAVRCGRYAAMRCGSADTIGA
jgi:hypothetical protein